MKTIIGLVLLATCVLAADQSKLKKAKVLLKPDQNGLIKSLDEATIFFTEQADGSVKVTGKISKVPKGKHGFHVHEKADLANGCAGAGSHFNPTNKNHGAPTDADRHVGDLGNVESLDTQVINVAITDKQIALSGQNNIIGRSIVLHELVDDLGKGTGAAKDESLKTGNAGKRIACGVIVEDK